MAWAYLLGAWRRRHCEVCKALASSYMNSVTKPLNSGPEPRDSINPSGRIGQKQELFRDWSKNRMVCMHAHILMGPEGNSAAARLLVDLPGVKPLGGESKNHLWHKHAFSVLRQVASA